VLELKALNSILSSKKEEKRERDYYTWGKNKDSETAKGRRSCMKMSTGVYTRSAYCEVFCFVFLSFSTVPGIEPRALHMLGKHSTTKLHPQPSTGVF
jgi:hypothetical protein